jgi:hypothetical protein
LSHDADSYLALLDTFSGHIAMQPWQRERLYAEIRRRLAQGPDGQPHRHWGAVLHVARTMAGLSPPSRLRPLWAGSGAVSGDDETAAGS